MSKFIQFVGPNAESVEVLKGPASVLYGPTCPLYDRAPRDVVLGALQSDGRTLNRTADYRLQDYAYRFGEVTTLGSGATGGVMHRVAVGASYQSTTLEELRRQASVAPIDILQPVYTGLPEDEAVPITSDVRQDVDIAAFFAQDQIALGSKVRLQLGVRHTSFRHEDQNRRTTRTVRYDASRHDTADWRRLSSAADAFHLCELCAVFCADVVGAR